MPAGAVTNHHFVLGLLNQQPMSGYDIKRMLSRMGWLIDGPSFGNIYPTLHALLEDGAVTVEVIPNENKPPRKVYSITEAGRRKLREWTDQPVGSRTSLKTFMMRLIIAGSFTEEKVITQLEQRQKQVAAYRAALEQHDRESTEDWEPKHLALDYGLALATTELAWLDSTLNRLVPQSLPLEVVQGDSGS